MPNVLNVASPHKIKVTLLQKKTLAQRSIVICILVCSLPCVKISSNVLVVTKTNATLVLDIKFYGHDDQVSLPILLLQFTPCNLAFTRELPLFVTCKQLF